MNKEEILAKSKKDNVYGDEREKQVRIKRDAFSLWGTIALGAVIMVIKLYRSESPSDIISILFCTSGLAFLYEGLKLKNKWSVIAGGIFLVLTCYYFYRFCVGLF